MECPVTRHALGFAKLSADAKGNLSAENQPLEHSDDGRLYMVDDPAKTQSQFACMKCIAATGAGRGDELVAGSLGKTSTDYFKK